VGGAGGAAGLIMLLCCYSGGVVGILYMSWLSLSSDGRFF